MTGAASSAYTLLIRGRMKRRMSIPTIRRPFRMHTILHPAGSNPDIIIIGGGASGLAAACAIARRGIPAILIEKNDKLGKKLLATGNGRCNVWNTGEPVYFGDDGFAEQVLQLTGASGVRAFLRDWDWLRARRRADAFIPPATAPTQCCAL
jgi:NADPH-dependent 2,4-dienoyl-CoA reductase/sulfur reductase-like enzyme